ncbi:hypothetical protein EDD22DRAFT_102065 [Suillus occidentalis]|nr:hypothetical protein EDD22DRAFT_102065 [Suillus occidentalis]
MGFRVCIAALVMDADAALCIENVIRRFFNKVRAAKSCGCVPEQVCLSLIPVDMSRPRILLIHITARRLDLILPPSP